MTWARPTVVSTVLFPIVLAVAIAPLRAGNEATLVDAVKPGDLSTIWTLLAQDVVDANDAKPDGRLCTGRHIAATSTRSVG